MITLFKAPPNEKTTLDLAQHLPNGRVWTSKNIKGTVMEGIVQSMAYAFNIVLQQVENLSVEFDINQSVDLLDDWETSVGIPDDCTGRLMGLDDRRKQVIRKLSKQPVVDLADLKEFIEDLVGVEVNLQTGAEVENLPLSLPFVLSSTNSLFKIYLSYVNTELSQGLPYSLPFPLGSVQEGLIDCAAAKVLPANVVLEIRRED